MSGVIYRPLSGMAEFSEAEALQRTVWGEGDKEDPADLLMVIQKEGGLVGGAFLEDRLMGFVFGFPTRDRTTQYSHRLAVHPDARGLGLGAGLKWFQRRWCLEQGITRICWTYDPLRLANAAMNIRALGGRSSTYEEDYYGAMQGINKGAPSDRLRVDWLLEHPAVMRRADGDRTPHPTADTDRQTVEIPADFDRLLASDPQAAVRIRLETRAAFQHHFSRGYAIADFDPAARIYVLVPREKAG